MCALVRALPLMQISYISTGIGYAMFLVSACVGIYYNMVIAWAFYYTFASFAKDVPWKTCNNTWNTEGLCQLVLDIFLLFCHLQGKRSELFFIPKN